MTIIIGNHVAISAFAVLSLVNVFPYSATPSRRRFCYQLQPPFPTSYSKIPNYRSYICSGGCIYYQARHIVLLQLHALIHVTHAAHDTNTALIFVPYFASSQLAAHGHTDTATAAPAVIRTFWRRCVFLERHIAGP